MPQTNNKDLDLDFPEVPDTCAADGSSLIVDNKDGTVTMPSYLFINFTLYILYVSEEEKIYNSWKTN